MSKVCWWSIGDGDHGRMLRTAVKSARKIGLLDDIHVWTDRNDIDGCTIHEAGSFDKSQYLFKFRFLKEKVAQLDYDYFIFFDADTYFVRPLLCDPLDMMNKSPIHSFLEAYTPNPQNKRPDWWGCPLAKYEELMRTHGIKHERIYNVNAGLWIVNKVAIDQIYDWAFYFWNKCKEAGFTFTEEAPLAYVTHLLCGDAELHTFEKWKHVWASDWTGAYKDRLPDGKEWKFQDYFTDLPVMVNPAIVHCMRSKGALING